MVKEGSDGCSGGTHMEKRIQLGIQEVFDVHSQEPSYDCFLACPGRGKGSRETGTAPSFDDKVRELAGRQIRFL